MPKNRTQDTFLPFVNHRWQYPDGLIVTAHNYDDALLAFEVVQYRKALGTLVPKNAAETRYLLNVLKNGESIDGFHCNDGFGTIIRIQKER